MKYGKQMQAFANWIASSPVRISEVRLKELIDDFSWKLHDRKAQPITLKDLQVVRRTLVNSLVPVIQGKRSLKPTFQRSAAA